MAAARPYEAILLILFISDPLAITGGILVLIISPTASSFRALLIPRKAAFNAASSLPRDDFPSSRAYRNPTLISTFALKFHCGVFAHNVQAIRDPAEKISRVYTRWEF